MAAHLPIVSYERIPPSRASHRDSVNYSAIRYFAPRAVRPRPQRSDQIRLQGAIMCGERARPILGPDRRGSLQQLWH